MTFRVCTTQCELSKVLAGSFPAKVSCVIGWSFPPSSSLANAGMKKVSWSYVTPKACVSLLAMSNMEW